MPSTLSTAIPGGRRYIAPTGDAVWLWPAEDRRFLQTVRTALRLQPAVEARDEDPAPQGTACVCLASPEAETIIRALRQSFPQVTVLGIGTGSSNGAHYVFPDQTADLAAGFAEVLQPSRSWKLPQKWQSLGLVALVLSAAIWLPYPSLFLPSQEEKETTVQQPPPAVQISPPQTKPARDLEIRPRFLLRSAPPIPTVEVSLFAAQPGKLIQLSVSLGQTVQTGDLLATIENTNALQEAESLRALALQKRSKATELRAQASRAITPPQAQPSRSNSAGQLQRAWQNTQAELTRFEEAQATLPPEARTQGLRRAHRSVLEKSELARLAWEEHQSEWQQRQEEMAALEVSLEIQQTFLLQKAERLEFEATSLRTQAEDLSANALLSLTASCNGVVKNISVGVGDNLRQGDPWIILQTHAPLATQ